MDNTRQNTMDETAVRPAATIFDLHAAVMDDYRNFIRSFFFIPDKRIHDFVRNAMENENALWPEPLVQLSPTYDSGQTVDELAAAGIILPETAHIFRSADGQPFRLYRHQMEAIREARHGRNFIVTSGTGSGKSICYFLPIIDHLLRNPVRQSGVNALVIYPMNALVNSQFQSLVSLQEHYEKRYGRPFPVSFARYTGETGDEERQRLRQQPPRMLLTNYVMAELMLVRPEDQSFLGHLSGGTRQRSLRFLVFDELHTYRGRQGADVAMLVRRLKERCATEDMLHIGTSATMVSHLEARPGEWRQSVATFASRFFGCHFGPEHIIGETLKPFTQGGPPSADELRAAMHFPLPEDIAGLRSCPLMRWLEYQLGIEMDGDGSFRRRTPRELSAVAADLSALTGESPASCLQSLQNLLSLTSRLSATAPSDVSLRPPAFKLHQFISQGRTIHATLESPADRDFSLDGQLKKRDGELFFPIRFCRHCGQEYYHVTQTEQRFLPYSPETNDEDFGGYLMLVTPERDWSPEQLPEDWLTPTGRVKQDYRGRVPLPVWVLPDGRYQTSPPDVQEEVAGEGPETSSEVGRQTASGGDGGKHPPKMPHKAWWQPAPFSICLSCGEYYTGQVREFVKFNSFSNEGRSSATTVLAYSLLRHAARTGIASDKLLTFTDNRQDASLQSGHFNDFVHVVLLRAALWRALQEHGELTSAEIAPLVFKASRLTLAHIAQNPSLDPESPIARDVFKTFIRLIQYRLYADLRRGWRVTHPNLEQVGLLRIAYRGLDELCTSSKLDTLHPWFVTAEPGQRKFLLGALLDYFRRRMAIRADVLDPDALSTLREQARQHLNEFWGLDPDHDELVPAARFVNQYFGNKSGGYDYVSVFRLTARTALGRFIRKQLGLTSDEYPSFMEKLLALLVSQGLLFHGTTSNLSFYQLNSACLVWQRGDGTPPLPDPVYSRNAQAVPLRPNLFFQRCYQSPPEDALLQDRTGSLAALEAREHTAQVVQPGERERRERRFRWSPRDQSPSLRRLPYLICSPTMELGVDIADLELVHLRNVPPTPANYAQRSGRAGRQGQPGLILTYCGAFNSHDQYFFRRRTDMVSGQVRAPRLDITNESLQRVHIHALWLSHIRLSLGESIENIIDIKQPELPLFPHIADAIRMTPRLRAEIIERAKSLLPDAADDPDVAAGGWLNDKWLSDLIESIPESFDRAFDRWRQLYRAADSQLRLAREELDRERDPKKQKECRRREAEALHQRNLLLQIGSRPEESDFYPYRYLASEGFLPGYNFPALPVRAWVPRGNEGDFIARPRTLAIRELAPQNILYHEGHRWRSADFLSSPGGLEKRVFRPRLCQSCGAFSSASDDCCPSCGTVFDALNSLVVPLLEMPNVRMRRRMRITADDEERQRLGYDLQTFFQLPDTVPDTVPGARIQKADVTVDGRPWFHLRYAASATLLRINHGLRQSRRDTSSRDVPSEKGFLVNMETGKLVSPHEQLKGNTQSDSDTSSLERFRLAVRTTHNVLLIRPADGDVSGQVAGGSVPSELSGGSVAVPTDAAGVNPLPTGGTLPLPCLDLNDPVLETTLRYALKRGIEETFELEDTELAAESIGEGSHRSILLYETSEGGAGVLRRLVEEPLAFSRVIRTALEICHFEFGANGLRDTRPDCHAACYECLLSFSNQSEALRLDRHHISGILAYLSRSRTEMYVLGQPRHLHFKRLLESIDERSVLERRFLETLERGGYRLPLAAQKRIDMPSCRPDFFYAPNICVFCDGAVHDHPSRSVCDDRLRERLKEAGYRVIVIRYDDDLPSVIASYPHVFGSGR